MTTAMDMVNEINPEKEAWNLKVRVIRLWTVPTFTGQLLPNSMEMILVDESGCKIQVTVRKTMIYRFKQLLSEGRVYVMKLFSVVPNQGSYRATRHQFKLIFQFRTTVKDAICDFIPKSALTISPFTELLETKEDSDFLNVALLSLFPNVVGLMVSMSEEKEYDKDGKKMKMAVIELAENDHKIRCALFGEYVDELNQFLSFGYAEQPVVVLQLAKVKVFRGKVGLQNVMFASKLGFNLDIPEVAAFRKSSIPHGVSTSQPIAFVGSRKNIRIEEDFMKLTPRCTVKSLDDNNRAGTFVVLAKIAEIVEDGPWWYSTCVCGRGVQAESEIYFCQFCNIHVTNVTPSIQSPPIFQEIVGKTMLFKVLSRPVGMEKFKGTYPVRCVCDHAAILGMFELSGSDLSPEKAGFVPKGERSFREPSKVTESPKLGLTPSSCSELFAGSPKCTEPKSSVVNLGVDEDAKCPLLKRKSTDAVVDKLNEVDSSENSCDEVDESEEDWKYERINYGEEESSFLRVERHTTHPNPKPNPQNSRVCVCGSIMSQNGKLMPNLDQHSTKLLNLTDLQRIHPFVEEILITAAYVTFYEFNIDLSQWVFSFLDPPNLCKAAPVFGCKIQAIVRKTMIYKFKQLLSEGRVYVMKLFSVVPNQGSYRATKHQFKLIFQFRTTVRDAICDFIPKSALTISPFTELLETKEDSDFLMWWVCWSLSEEKEYDKDGKKMKMAVMELAENDHRIRCALFGEYVDELNRFLSSGYAEQPVVVLQLAKVKVFRGRVGLQNVMFASKLGFNLDIPEVVAFRKSSIPHGVSASQPIGIVGSGKNIGIEEDFMKLTPMCTVKSLDDNNRAGTFVVLVKIAEIVEDGPWWYFACVLVEDSTGIFIFVLFDREASYLLNKTCAQLFEHLKDVDVVFGTQSPPMFQEIVGKTMLFKVLSRPVGMEKFKGTYPVRRVCDDAAILGMFELSSSDLISEKAGFVPKGDGSFGEPSKVTKSLNLGLTPSSCSELFAGSPQCTQPESSCPLFKRKSADAVVDKFNEVDSSEKSCDEVDESCVDAEKDVKPSLKKLRRSLRLQFDEADESRGSGNDGSSGHGVN
ncbi:hypothetical protein Ahy_B10g103942 isoform F [Arachis hypogaea]|uniref:Replication protein A 70 kDa DNA-binding subunit B/D first OB fold domain-containing protein n=1 Tax=Arachis hypogaea TaxID=3818 RepID=A0A444X4D9_ARAHY|nr:hypothetical protein Ahy_B10g103942 isoform F [Arachis hypogaea]